MRIHTVRETLTARVWLPLAILAVAGCRDATGPLDGHGPVGLQPQLLADSSLPPNILQQSPSAPLLETYQVAFWAYKQGPASTITVSYQNGQPFLGFHIPRNSLQDFAASDSLQKGDSILITLTIDPVRFLVDFQPSGLLFSRSLPATLAMCYENANPDLNGDGVVDSTDQALEEQLAIWSETGGTSGWFKLSSKDNPTQQCVAAPVVHFSQYAILW